MGRGSKGQQAGELIKECRFHGGACQLTNNVCRRFLPRGVLQKIRDCTKELKCFCNVQYRRYFYKASNCIIGQNPWRVRQFSFPPTYLPAVHRATSRLSDTESGVNGHCFVTPLPHTRRPPQRSLIARFLCPAACSGKRTSTALCRLVK
jgi:hypothetical protein